MASPYRKPLKWEPHNVHSRYTQQAAKVLKKTQNHELPVDYALEVYAALKALAAVGAKYMEDTPEDA
jgi:hypothetical protein